MSLSEAEAVALWANQHLSMTTSTQRRRNRGLPEKLPSLNLTAFQHTLHEETQKQGLTTVSSSRARANGAFGGVTRAKRKVRLDQEAAVKAVTKDVLPAGSPLA